ncbi:RibD family protein [Acidihalobacter prosperus]
MDLGGVMKLLAQRNINEVHVEAGATLAGALTREKLVDEFVFYIAPNLLGENARNVLILPTIENMSERLEFKITQVRRVGDDCRVIARPN